MSAPALPVFDAPVADKAETEIGTVFRPRFDENGLITAVATDAETGTVVMLAYMNEEALARTIATGIAHYWSRSRGQLWRKGESSGHEQSVVELRVDCDQDAILLAVKTAGTGANCHTGRKSCFFRRIVCDDGRSVRLALDEADTPRFDHDTVYRDQS